MKTLLKSMRTVTTKDVIPGQYHHFGIINGVKKSLSLSKLSVPPKEGYLSMLMVSHLQKVRKTYSGQSLLVNVDGIPLTEITKNVFWPIAAKIADPFIGRPFTVGIYYGQNEPNDFNLFLYDFVEEAKLLKREGFEFDGKNVKVKVLGFICDAPARAKITCTVSHNSYFGCSKCLTRGEYYKVPGSSKGRVTFSVLDCNLRTDQTFRMRVQPEHHLSIRPKIEELPINMVMDIPDEEMHLLDLGCMRKMLIFMTAGKGTPARLRPHQIKELSERLESLVPHVPCDFSRKPRTLRELKLWKATELHFVLMYDGVT